MVEPKSRDRYLFDIPFVAPRSTTEQCLAEVWIEILAVDRVGINDDFFHLDGDSLLATRVNARIRALFGAELTMRALFEAPTIAQLAEQVQRVSAAQTGTAGAVESPTEENAT